MPVVVQPNALGAPDEPMEDPVFVVGSQSWSPDPAARADGAWLMAPKPLNTKTADVAARRARPGLLRERAVSDTATHVLEAAFQTSIKMWFICKQVSAARRTRSTVVARATR